MKVVGMDGLKRYHGKVKELVSTHTHLKSQITDFPDTPGYETGTWTPVYKDENDAIYSGNNASKANPNLRYLNISDACYEKIGDIVILTMNISASINQGNYQDFEGYTKVDLSFYLDMSSFPFTCRHFISGGLTEAYDSTFASGHLSVTLFGPSGPLSTRWIGIDASIAWLMNHINRVGIIYRNK